MNHPWPAACRGKADTISNQITHPAELPKREFRVLSGIPILRFPATIETAGQTGVGVLHFPAIKTYALRLHAGGT